MNQRHQLACPRHVSFKRLAGELPEGALPQVSRNYGSQDGPPLVLGHPAYKQGLFFRQVHEILKAYRTILLNHQGKWATTVPRRVHEREKDLDRHREGLHKRGT